MLCTSVKKSVGHCLHAGNLPIPLCRYSTTRTLCHASMTLNRLPAGIRPENTVRKLFMTGLFTLTIKVAPYGISC